jgi:hypothetical protein
LQQTLQAIERVQQVRRPVDEKLLIIICAGIGILIVTLLIFLLFGTKSAEVDIFVKKLKKIFKKHGTRLVALNSEIIGGEVFQNKVRRMEDLVRVSDELGKPIVYKHSENYKENSKFWVIDENRYYLFELEVEESRGSSYKERVKVKGEKDWKSLNGRFFVDN